MNDPDTILQFVGSIYQKLPHSITLLLIIQGYYNFHITSFIKPVILLGFQLSELCACITPFNPILGRICSVVLFIAVGNGRW